MRMKVQQALAVLVTALLSCSAVSAHGNAPAASLAASHSNGAATDQAFRRSVAENKTSGELDARNQPDCKPSTVTITQNVVSTKIITTTISGGGAGGGGGAGAPGGSPTQGKPATTSPPDPKSPPAPGGGGGNSKSCSCPHTTTIAFEGDRPPPRRARRQVGGACTCTVSASRTGPPFSPSLSGFTGQKTPLEGALPPNAPPTAKFITTVLTTTPPGGQPTEVTQTLSQTINAVEGQSAGAGAPVVSVYTTTPSGGQPTVITTTLVPVANSNGQGKSAVPPPVVKTTEGTGTAADSAKAATETSTGFPYPGLNRPTRPDKSSDAEGNGAVRYRINRSKRVGIWDMSLDSNKEGKKGNQGGWNTQISSTSHVYVPSKGGYFFMATFKDSKDWEKESPESVRRCDIWGTPKPTTEFVTELIPESPFLRTLEKVDGVQINCAELCTQKEVTLDVPGQMSLIMPDGNVTNGPNQIKETRQCVWGDQNKKPIAVQMFPEGQNNATSFSSKDLVCTLSGNFLSNDTEPSIKLQSQFPYLSTSIAERTDGVSLICKDAPRPCTSGMGARQVKLKAGDHVSVAFDKKDQVDNSPALIGGPEETYIYRGCDGSPTKVSFKIFKSDVKKETFDKATPEKKATCEISGFADDVPTSIIEFNANQPFYKVHPNSGLWVSCKEDK